MEDICYQPDLISKDSEMSEKTKRRAAGRAKRPADRKESIVTDTYDLILEHGITGSTTARIAAKGGITEAALYRHYKSRSDILLAVFEMVAKRFIDLLIIPEDNVIDYIRKISNVLYDYIVRHPQDPKVMFEFVCSSPSENLRGTFQERLIFMLDFLEGLLTNGVEQGSVNADVDLRLAAWELFSLGSTLSLATMVDLSSDLTKDRALSSVDSFLERISAQRISAQN